MAHLISKEVFIPLLLWGLQVKGTASIIHCDVGLKPCITAKACYDPVTQFCCDSTVKNSHSGLFKCCHLGRGKTKVFHTDEHICCNKKLRKRNKPDDVICCDNQIRSTSLGLCCNNVWRGTLGRDDRACCGSKDYNIKTENCCTKWTPTGIESMPRLRKPNSACCGLQIYDTVNQRCGSDDKIRKQFEFSCGTFIYDSRPQMCCNGKVIDSSNRRCCGGKAQHVDDEICCRDPYTGTAQVFTKTPNRVCCGGVYMDVTDGQICCNYKLYQMDPAKGFCCNGELIPGTNGNGLQCCGSDIYDPDEYQCSNKKIFPKTMKLCGHEETDCVCNGEMINRQEKLCCKWLPVDKSGMEDDKCCTRNSKQITFNSKSRVSNPCWNPAKCGTQQLLYDDTKYICCGENVLNKYVFGESCCGNIAYRKTEKTFYVDGTDVQICCKNKTYQMDPAKGFCCNGELIPGTNGNGLQCCGSHIYDPDEYQCSNKNIFPKTMKLCGHEESDCVCNGEMINRQEKLCCGRLPVIKSGIEDDRCCTRNSKQITFNSKSRVSNPCWNPERCDGQPYDDTKYICCGGNVLNRIFGDSCCRDIAYNKTEKRCNENGRLTKLDAKCRKIKTTCKSEKGQKLDDNIKGVLITGKLGKQRCRKGTESFELRELYMYIHGIKYDLSNIRSFVGYHKLKIKIPRKCSLNCLPENGSKVAILINPRSFLEKASKSNGKTKYRLHPRRDEFLFSVISNADRKTNRYQAIHIKWH